MRSRPYIFTKFPTSTWACVAYVIVGGTFLAYILMMIGQKTLRPTVISMYNYVQPIVGTSVSILLGMGTFGIAKGIAVHWYSREFILWLKVKAVNRCWLNKQPRKNNLNYTAIRNQTLFTDHKSVSTLLLSNDTAFYVFKGILRQLAPPISVSPNMLSYPPKAVLPVDDS